MTKDDDILIEECLDVLQDHADQIIEHETPADALCVALGWLIRRPDEPTN